MATTRMSALGALLCLMGVVLAACNNASEVSTDSPSPVTQAPPADDDNDGIPNANDNCPVVPNPSQANLDQDSLGDVCDDDDDGDNVNDVSDNCPVAANADQADNDGDGLGNVCDSTPNGDGNVHAVIKPSRTVCASPCTVVFSAENTTATGLDSHGVWSQLSYYWDFDTDETDTYGSLYQQTYSYVEGDTAHEVGHVPLVTKTFLCATGQCSYRIGMRAQNAAGDYDDAYVNITVDAESQHWSAADTVCISNTLNTASDWAAYDKPCPVGATKRNTTLDADAYNGKLILLKKGDVFSQNIATYPNQSNFKIGVFGNNADARPEIDGEVDIGFTNIPSPTNAPVAANYLNLTDAVFENFGSWPSNVYVEGLKIGAFDFPMSYQHIGLHDIDMDREAYNSGGRIGVSAGSLYCINNSISCSNVPFPKGGYISSVDIVGFTDPVTGGPGVNIVDTGCSMANFLGIVDTRVRRAREHNLRIAGWYRLSIMRSAFRGEHFMAEKAKLTPRRCLAPDIIYGGNGLPHEMISDWVNTRTDLPAGYMTDPEGRTRVDQAIGTTYWVHASRYMVVNGNVLGERGLYVNENNGGSFGIDTSSSYPDGTIITQDFLLTKNIVVSENDLYTAGGFDVGGHWGTCVDNDYRYGTFCASYSANNAIWHPRVEPTPTMSPLVPGS